MLCGIERVRTGWDWSRVFPCPTPCLTVRWLRHSCFPGEQIPSMPLSRDSPHLCFQPWSFSSLALDQRSADFLRKGLHVVCISPTTAHQRATETPTDKLHMNRFPLQTLLVSHASHRCFSSIPEASLGVWLGLLPMFQTLFLISSVWTFVTDSSTLGPSL